MTTAEMAEAGWAALPVSAQESGDVDLDDMAAVIAAVFILVERDYRLFPNCTDELMPGLRCLLQAHARGEHEGKTSTGNTVRWS